MVNIIKDIEENVEKAEKAVEKVLKKGEKVAKKVVEEVEEALGVEPKKSQSESGVKKSKKSDSKKLEEVEKVSNADEPAKEKSIEERKKALLEKAEKLKEKVEGIDLTSEELKEQVKIKKRTDMLIPLEEYVKSGIYLGTRVVTPDMKQFVYRRRADGLAIFNTDLIDEKLKEGIEYLSKFNPEDVILICKRQAGWRAAEKFSELTGIRVFTKKYPAGILTNKQLPDFFENEMTIIIDQWIDKNALNDTLKVRKKVLMVCDTNNFSKGASQVIIGNNKSERSLGVIFYLLATGYCRVRGIKADIPDLSWWTGEEFEEKKTRKRKALIAEAGVAEFGV